MYLKTGIKVANADTDQDRLRAFRPLQDIQQRIQLANDECDFGMGLGTDFLNTILIMFCEFW